MLALALIILSLYVLISSQRQSGLIYEKLQDVMGEQVAKFMMSTLGAAILAIGLMLGIGQLVA